MDRHKQNKQQIPRKTQISEQKHTEQAPQHRHVKVSRICFDTEADRSWYCQMKIDAVTITPRTYQNNKGTL